MLTHLTSKSSPPQSSYLYRCPGCNEMVEGSQLSEVLLHHRHVLDSYRLRIIGVVDAARTRSTRKRRRKADRR
jgi:hypothetical protein